MQVQTTDVLVRVKGLSNLSLVVSDKRLVAKAFDLVMRNLYSDAWVMLDPSVFSYKLQDTPKTQIIEILERLGRQRLANVFRCDSDDNRRCYIVMYNPRFIVKTCRRKRNVYVMHRLSKSARQLVGDMIVIDQDKCGTYWIDKLKVEKVDEEYRVNMKNLEWKRVL